MARVVVPERLGKPVVWVAAATPLAILVYNTFWGSLGIEPVDTLTKWTGNTTIIILLATLGITPLRRLTGWNRLIKYRRLVGLWAFAYAVLHFLVWALFDHRFALAEMLEDITKRPYITVGFTALVILLSLAVTSPQAVLRWMGGKRWGALHRLVYVAAGLGVLHYWWSVKKDITMPATYAVILAVLLISRPALKPRVGRARQPRPAATES